MRYALLYLLVVAPLTAFAQNALVLEDTVVSQELYERFPRYRLSQVGLSINTLRDEALSPLRYQGSGFVANYQYWKYKGDRRLVQNNVGFDITAYANTINNNSISAIEFSYQHTPLYPVALKASASRLYIGWFIRPMFNIKALPDNTNNAVSYEFITSLGASGLFQHRFTLFHAPVIFSEQLSFSLLSLALRPQYAWPVPVVAEEEGRLGADLQLGSWNRHFSVTNQVSLNFYTNKKRKRRVMKKVSHQLSYSWNFYTMHRPVLLQDASHALTYSRVLKID